MLHEDPTCCLQAGDIYNTAEQIKLIWIGLFCLSKDVILK